MSLTEHTSRVRDDALHQVDRGFEAGPAHVLHEPFECGDRWWIQCRCGWLGSADRLIDLSPVCELKQLAWDFELAAQRLARIAAREAAELQRLLKRTA